MFPQHQQDEVHPIGSLFLGSLPVIVSRLCALLHYQYRLHQSTTSCSFQCSPDSSSFLMSSFLTPRVGSQTEYVDSSNIFPHIVIFAEDEDDTEKNFSDFEKRGDNGASPSGCSCTSSLPIRSAPMDFKFTGYDQIFSARETYEAFMNYFYTKTSTFKAGNSVPAPNSADKSSKPTNSTARGRMDSHARSLSQQGKLIPGMSNGSLPPQREESAEEEIRTFFYYFFVEAQRCAFEALQVIEGDVSTGVVPNEKNSGPGSGEESMEPVGGLGSSLFSREKDLSHVSSPSLTTPRSFAGSQVSPPVLVLGSSLQSRKGEISEGNSISTPPMAGDDGSEENDAQRVILEEAQMALQYIIRLAFSCPIALIATAGQLVLGGVVAKREQLVKQAIATEGRQGGSSHRSGLKSFFQEHKNDLAVIRPLNFSVSPVLHRQVVNHQMFGTSSSGSFHLPPEGSDDELELNCKDANKEKVFVQKYIQMSAEEQIRRIRFAGETLELKLAFKRGSQHIAALHFQEKVLLFRGDGSICVQTMKGLMESDSSGTFWDRHSLYISPSRCSGGIPMLQHVLGLNLPEQEMGSVMRGFVRRGLLSLLSRSPTTPSSTSPLGSPAAGGAHALPRGFASSRISESRRIALLMALAHCEPFVPRAATSLSRGEILWNVFNEFDECPNYYNFLAATPSASLVVAHHSVQRFLFLNEGPLPLEVRLMLGVMIASRHRCFYLVRRFAGMLWMYLARVASLSKTGSSDLEMSGSWSEDDEEEEMSGEGTRCTRCFQTFSQLTWKERRERWLSDGPPRKLRVVQRWIELASKQPWLFDELDVRGCLEQGWTIPQLFQLTTLVASVLGTVSFVMGLSVQEEPWTAAVLPNKLLQRMKTAHEQTLGESSAMHPCGTGFRSSVKATQRHSSSAIDEEGSDLFELYAGPSVIPISEGRSHCPSSHRLWSSNFDWQERGAAFLEQYYPGIASVLLEETECWRDTIRLVSPEDCAAAFPLTVSPEFSLLYLRYYLLNLLGYQMNDFHLEDINKILFRRAKAFAQQMVIRPESLIGGEMSRTGMSLDGDSASQRIKKSEPGVACNFLEELLLQSEREVVSPTLADKAVGEVRSLWRVGDKELSFSALSSFVSLLTRQLYQEALLIEAYELRHLHDVETDNLWKGSTTSPVLALEALKSLDSEMWREKQVRGAPHAPFCEAGHENSQDGESQHCALSVEQREELIHYALTMWEEKADLLIGTTAMIARRDGILNLFLYSLSSFLHDL